MKIEVLYFEGCPSYLPALDSIREAVAEQDLQAEIELVCINSPDQAEAAQFSGSPTILINGVDLEGLTAEGERTDLSCRIYTEGGRMRGWPPKEAIHRALSDAREGTGDSLRQHRCCPS